MGKALYVGVSSKAHKGKKGWVGVDGKARKIKKMWIGDANGKARLCFSGDTPMYVGLLCPWNYGGSDTVYMGYSLDGTTFTATTQTVTGSPTMVSLAKDGYLVHSDSEGSIYTTDGKTYNNASNWGNINPFKLIYHNNKYYAVCASSVETENTSNNYGSTKKYDRYISLYYKNNITDSSWTLVGKIQTYTGDIDTKSSSSSTVRLHFLTDAIMVNSELYAVYKYMSVSAGMGGGSTTYQMCFKRISSDMKSVLDNNENLLSSSSTFGDCKACVIEGGSLVYLYAEGSSRICTYEPSTNNISLVDGYFYNNFNGSATVVDGRFCFAGNQYVYIQKNKNPTDISVNTNDYHQIFVASGASVGGVTAANGRLYYSITNGKISTVKDGYVDVATGIKYDLPQNVSHVEYMVF